MARYKKQPSKGVKKTRRSTQGVNDTPNSRKKAKEDKKKGNKESTGKKRCAMCLDGGQVNIFANLTRWALFSILMTSLR